MLTGEPTTVRVTKQSAEADRSDEALIDDVNAGNHAAFDTLYFRHRDYVVNLASRVTGDRDLALDVLQETFVYFAKKFPGFTLTCRLRSFLYPVVRNLSLTALKKFRRSVSLDEALARGVPEPMEQAPPHDGAEELRDVLTVLSEEHRETLILRFVEGFTLAEIAEVFGCAVGTVKSRLHHALKLLRENPRTRRYFESLK